MAKNDFDIDFDFEKEYGFDPKAVLDSDEEQMDFSQLEKELGIDLNQVSGEEDDFADFDFSPLDLGDEPASTVEDDQVFTEAEPVAFADFDLDEEDDEAFGEEPEEEELDPEDDLDFGDIFEDEDDDLFDEEEDLAADFTRRADFFNRQEPRYVPEEVIREEVAEEPAYEEPVYEEPAYEGPTYDAPAYDADEEEDMDPEDEDFEDDEQERPDRRRDPSRQRTPREPVKLAVPPVLMKLYTLYFPPKEAFEPKADPNNPRRRRRKSKLQIFKEAYLPAILACLSLVLVLAFIVGAIGNAFARKEKKDQLAQQESIAAAESQVQAQVQAQAILEDAKRMAAGYDYQGAIDLLDTYTGEATEEINKLKSDYLTAKSQLVEHKDPTLIPNLSFHVLIADPARAFPDETYGGQYNRNFVTIEEFSKILEQLYKNNYVLVDYDSFVARSAGLEGNESFFSDSIWLPAGKKPVMITETMVNYYSYMTDSNGDGMADAGADGFASRLVVANGEIKAEYIDVGGQTQVGDYDLVPILETFIKAHPDFVYKGARATLAVSGYDGVFGYRVNTSVVSTKGNEYYEQQVNGAKEVVAALKNKGYNIACYTFEDIAYGGKSATQIKADMEQWVNQITPVLGNVDTLVFAKTSDIQDYSGTVFDMLYDYGFRIFVKNADTPYTEVNTTYVRQSRLMVTGNALAWKSDKFASLFDSNMVINLTARGGKVPN
jgi:hypothetical protein